MKFAGSVSAVFSASTYVISLTSVLSAILSARPAAGGCGNSRSSPGLLTQAIATPGLAFFQKSLTSMGVTDTSSCMREIKQLMAVNATSATVASQSVCLHANFVLRLLQNATKSCQQAQAEFASNDTDVGSGEDDFNETSQGTERIWDGLTSQLTKCCHARSASPAECLVTGGYLHGLQETYSTLVLTTNSTLDTPEMGECSALSSTVHTHLGLLQQNVYKLMLTAPSSPLAGVLKSVHQLQKLTVVLSGSGPQTAPSLAESTDIQLLLCSSIFPLCVKEERVKPCPSICRKAGSMLHSMKAFLNISSIPILSVLNEAGQSCLAPTKASSCLLDSMNNKQPELPYVIVNTSSALAHQQQQGGFCLNACTSPLRPTTDPSHWDKEVQDALSSIHFAVRLIFPNSTLLLNRQLLPCGRDCVSVGIIVKEQRKPQIILSVFASIAAISVIFSAFIFFFNRHDIGCYYIRRTAFMFTVCGGIGLLPYAFSFRGNSDGTILCHSDGTLVTEAKIGSEFSCWFTAWFSHFFAMMGLGYIVVLAYSWQQMPKLLRQPSAILEQTDWKTSMTTWWTRLQKDFLTFFLVLLAPAGQSIAVAIQGGYGGSPILGTCALNYEGHFARYYTWYHVVALFPNSFFLARGIHGLVKKYGVFGMLHWMKGKEVTPRVYAVKVNRSPPAKSTSSVTGQSRTIRGLKLFSRHLLFCLLLSTVSILCNIMNGLYLELNLDDWNRQARLHIQCTLTSCSQELCPPLPEVAWPIFVAPLAVSFTSVFFLTTWAYSTTYLVNVPLIGELITRYQVRQAKGQRRRTLQVGMSSLSNQSNSSAGSASSTLPLSLSMQSISKSKLDVISDQRT